jgi:hypothetical protein
MKNNEVVWTRFYDELEREYRRKTNRLTEKVKIKSWQQMLDENHLDSDGDIQNDNSTMYFTSLMELFIPDNRVVNVYDECRTFPKWSNNFGYWIDEWMIDKTWKDNQPCHATQ